MSILDPSAVIEAMETAARVAGRSLVELRNQQLDVRSKAPGELVTDADVRSQALIVDHLGQSFPEVGIFADEGSGHRSTEPTRFIIDPLDGTTAWVYGISGFSVSCAYEMDGQIEAAVVYDPVFDELYTAVRGSGAHRNNVRIQVAATVPLQDALIVFDWGNAAHLRAEGIAAFGRVNVPEMKARRIVPQFAPALGLAHLAEGRIHALVCNDTQVEDHAAGALLIAEAGGAVNDFEGGDFSHRIAGIQAACSAELSAELRQAWQSEDT